MTGAMKRRGRATRTAAAVAAFAAAVAAAGCADKSGEGGATNPGSAPRPVATAGAQPAAVGGGGGGAGTDLVAAGRTVYSANGCANCHAINGQGGRMGPDLSRTGAASEHTAQWLVEHVRNPKAHNPSSRMPSYGGKINDKDLLALGAYLASLK